MKHTPQACRTGRAAHDRPYQANWFSMNPAEWNTWTYWTVKSKDHLTAPGSRGFPGIPEVGQGVFFHGVGELWIIQDVCFKTQTVTISQVPKRIYDSCG